MGAKLKQYVMVAAVLAGLLVVFGGFGLVGAAEGSARSAECRYVIASGDSLIRISGRVRIPVDVMAELNPEVIDVSNLNYIRAGDILDVCDRTGARRDLMSPAFPADVGNGVVPVAPRSQVVPSSQLEVWTDAVIDEAPDWASPADVAFLVRIAFPESGMRVDAWNPGDANASFLGSYGFIQVRVLRNPPSSGFDSIRNLEVLRDDPHAQARAAFIILRAQGRSAWGPTTNGIMPGGGCAGSSRASQCWDWAARADAAIAADGRVS